MIARTARRQIPEWRGGADAFHGDLGTYLPRLIGDGRASPILKKTVKRVLALSVAYDW
jgi:hypothetical protein